VGGSLAVTRALGDHALKAGPPACGVTADPAIVAREVGATDRFLILASDGLWDVLSEAQAQAHVLASGGGAGGLQAVAASLVRKAIEEGTRDNVSVLLVKLS
jgi:serine/threonine protein phosphatase PrpC